MKAKSPKGRIIAYLGDWCEKYGCKSHGILVGLTAGKEYPVLSRTDFDDKNYLTIVNDFGKEMSINSTRMKVVHEEVCG